MPIRQPIFVVPLPLTNLTADSVTAGHPVTNLARFDAIGLTWKSGTSGSSHWVRGQFPASRAVDFCSVIAANALSGTDVRLRLGTSQAQVDGSAPYDSSVQDFISPTPSPTPADGLYHSHLELASPVNATWFRIDITGHTGAFEAAMIVLGKRVQPARFYNWDYERGIEDLGEAKFTQYGVLDEDPGLIFRSLDFTLGWVSEAEFEESFQPMLRQLGTRGIVYCCFDPEATNRRQSKTYMGLLKKPGFARGIRKPQTYTQDFSIISMI